MTEGELDAIFSDWGHWLRTRRILAPSDRPQGTLGKLRSPSGRGGDGPDAPMDARLAALNIAIGGLPDPQRAVLYAHYIARHRVRVHRMGEEPIKTLAERLGLGRTGYYSRLRTARRDAWDRVALVEDVQRRLNKIGELIGEQGD